MHIPNIRRTIAREHRPPKRRPELPGPVPTLGELQSRYSTWVWGEGLRPGGEPCQHKAPVALAPFVIRWGPEARATFFARTYAVRLWTPWGGFAAIVGVQPFRGPP